MSGLNSGINAPNGPLCNTTAISAPTVNDDAGDGYGVLSEWVDTATGITYVCTDATAGAAVWRALAGANETNTWSGAQINTAVALTMSGATTSVNAASGNYFEGDLSIATTELANPTNLTAGQFLTFVIQQDGTGGRDVTYGTYYEWGDEGEPDVSALTANEYCVITVIVVTTTRLLCTYLGGFAQ